MWYRVFCRSDTEVKPADLLVALQTPDRVVDGRFTGDDLGWTAAELSLGPGTPIHIERYLTSADEIRGDLNTWAAYLETRTYSPNHGMLMERMIQTGQLITLRPPLDHANESAVEDVCQSVCRILATAGDGVYQIENVGWYAADGTLLLQEY